MKCTGTQDMNLAVKTAHVQHSCIIILLNSDNVSHKHAHTNIHRQNTYRHTHIHSHTHKTYTTSYDLNNQWDSSLSVWITIQWQQFCKWANISLIRLWTGWTNCYNSHRHTHTHMHVHMHMHTHTHTHTYTRSVEYRQKACTAKRNSYSWYLYHTDTNNNNNKI